MIFCLYRLWVVFKILNGNYSVDRDLFFAPDDGGRLGHSRKLLKRQCRLVIRKFVLRNLEATHINCTNHVLSTYNTVRASYFSIHIANVWNSLPADRVDFSSFASFKRTVQQTDLLVYIMFSYLTVFSWVIVSVLDLIIQFTLCTWMWCFFYIFLFTCVTCVRINDDDDDEIELLIIGTVFQITVSCSMLNNFKSSDVVLETRVLVSRCLKDKNESLGLGSWSLGLCLEHLVLVLKKKSCSFSRLLSVM